MKRRSMENKICSRTTTKKKHRTQHNVQKREQMAFILFKSFYYLLANSYTSSNQWFYERTNHYQFTQQQSVQAQTHRYTHTHILAHLTATIQMSCNFLFFFLFLWFRWTFHVGYFSFFFYVCVCVIVLALLECSIFIAFCTILFWEKAIGLNIYLMMLCMGCSPSFCPNFIFVFNFLNFSSITIHYVWELP